MTKIFPKKPSKASTHSRANSILEIKNLQVSVENKEIIKGLTLTIRSGEMHIIMGPNGSGKSTLCYAIMGHPKYTITSGQIHFNGKDIKNMSVDHRAQLGLFLGFQYSREIPGVTFGNFLRQAKNAIQKANDAKAALLSPLQFLPIIQNEMKNLKMDKKFIGRNINEGFSGGEKKRAEIVQMAILEPKIAMLDEIDSGLDIDALKIVAQNIQKKAEEKKTGMLIITHYQRILNYLKPDHVHLMAFGKILKSGDHRLAIELEKNGYEKYISQK